MNLLSLVVPTLFNLLVLGLFAYLFVRGVTHLFVGLFAAGALLHGLQMFGYLLLSRMPGGVGANAQYLPAMAIAGALGTILFAVAFVLLAMFLLRNRGQQAELA